MCLILITLSSQDPAKRKLMNKAILLLIGAVLWTLRPSGAQAADTACAGAQVLGTPRTIAVGGGVTVGLKTYPQTLDLNDHEVVLTFDDGPSPRTTPRILDALAAECVKATFFLIGQNAAAAPALVRREVTDGHTVGHHTWSHPAVTLRGLSEALALDEIDRGMMTDDKAAYGTARDRPRVPFFRFPGFADTKPLLDDLAKRNIAVFGADLWASDWIPMTPETELEHLMDRLGRARRGIILLHDTKEQTAEMMPAFLAALRAGGYHVVGLVPGPPGTVLRPAPAGWTSETEVVLSHAWPRPTPHEPARLGGPLRAIRPSPASMLDHGFVPSVGLPPADDGEADRGTATTSEKVKEAE